MRPFARYMADANPVFTFRVTKRAKREIRTQLEQRYSLRSSTVYPDMFGLAKHLAERPDLLLG